MPGSTQVARRFSEDWWEANGYCLNCESPRVQRTRANTPACDFICPECEHRFELKAKQAAFVALVNDGAYRTMVERIRDLKTPSFLLMRYTPEPRVLSIDAIHRSLITEAAILERKPTWPKGRSNAFYGCNISLRDVAPEARIPVITSGQALEQQSVRSRFRQLTTLEKAGSSNLGWLNAVLVELHKHFTGDFTTADAYRLEATLQEKFPRNSHIREKIRQQLQLLEKRGLLERLERGRYTFKL